MKLVKKATESIYIYIYIYTKKRLNSTTNVSISEEISSGLREILRCAIYIYNINIMQLKLTSV